MAQNRSQKQKRQDQSGQDEARDEANKRRFVYQSGLVAQDLPDAAHGQNVVDDPHEVQRRLPQQHGGTTEGDSGLRASMNAEDADVHGHRGKN